ncbi:hypothetical protein BV20DRAFT_591556 [Pilatotrama ljubarskyi]|nr:hypothetical protein BV20DRAFT_591556 [Pilatotrama ljubarskyi]
MNRSRPSSGRTAIHRTDRRPLKQSRGAATPLYEHPVLAGIFNSHRRRPWENHSTSASRRSRRPRSPPGRRTTVRDSPHSGIAPSEPERASQNRGREQGRRISAARAQTTTEPIYTLWELRCSLRTEGPRVHPPETRADLQDVPEERRSAALRRYERTYRRGPRPT